MPQDTVDDLVALLDLEPIEVNIFRGVSPEERVQRVFAPVERGLYRLAGVDPTIGSG